MCSFARCFRNDVVPVPLEKLWIFFRSLATCSCLDNLSAKPVKILDGATYWQSLHTRLSDSVPSEKNGVTSLASFLCRLPVAFFERE